MTYFKQTEFRTSAITGDRLSAEELLLIEEKAALTRAVEQLSLRRQAVAAARRKTEAEVHRQERKGEAHVHDVEESLRSSEAECRRLQAEEKALHQVTADLAQRRVEMESARQLTAGEAHRSAEVAARRRLQETVGRHPVPVRKGKEEPSRWAGREEIQRVEPQVRRPKPQEQAQPGLTLEQRLRAEIDEMASAQRKHIDAAQARLAVLRNNSARATSAA